MTAATFLRLDWLGPERRSGYAKILALASAVSLFWLFQEAMGPTGSDFLAFWSAARLTLAHHAAAAYDLEAVRAVQFGRAEAFAFVNPPPFLLAIWPLGWLSYPAAWLAWIAATYAAWLAITRRAAPGLTWPIAAFPGALVAAWHAQTGFFTSALQAGAATLLRTRPLLAGLCVGALVVKPHLALLFPVALAAGGHWRAFAGAAMGAIGLLLLSWGVFGTATMLAYTASWEVSRELMAHSEPEFFLRQTTVYALLRGFGWETAATAAQAICTAAMAWLTWRAWARPAPLEAQFAVLFAATGLATPYLFAYDLPFLIVPLCWLARSRAAWSLGAADKPLLLALYLAPLAVRAVALPLGANLMPFVLGVMLWLCWRSLNAGDEAPR